MQTYSQRDETLFSGPAAVPFRCCLRVGVALGDVLLEQYLKQEGKYPENIGIVVWATELYAYQWG
jgi:cobalamin biosynthesis Mg chelatase CobN